MLRRFAWNLLFLGIGIVLIVVWVLIPSVAMIPAAALFLGLAAALGTSPDGRYRVLAPHRSLLVSAGALFVSCVLGFASGAGLSSLLWIVIGALVLAVMAAVVLETALIRLFYRIARGQKFDFRNTLRRDWIWLVVPVLSLSVMAGIWLSLV